MEDYDATVQALWESCTSNEDVTSSRYAKAFENNRRKAKHRNTEATRCLQRQVTTFNKKQGVACCQPPKQPTCSLMSSSLEGGNSYWVIVSTTSSYDIVSEAAGVDDHFVVAPVGLRVATGECYKRDKKLENGFSISRRGLRVATGERKGGSSQ